MDGKKKRFLIKFTLIYAACLILSLGLGLVLAAVLNEVHLHKHWITAGVLIPLAALAAGRILAGRAYRRFSAREEGEGENV